MQYELVAVLGFRDSRRERKVLDLRSLTGAAPSLRHREFQLCLMTEPVRTIAPNISVAREVRAAFIDWVEEGNGPQDFLRIVLRKHQP